MWRVKSFVRLVPVLMVVISIQIPGSVAHCDDLDLGAPRFIAREVLKLDWGAGPTEVGLTELPEGRFGPQSVFIRDNGSEIAVLDSSNNRVLEFSANGTLLRSISLDTRYDDLVVRDDSSVAVLRVADRVVQVVGERGEIEEAATFSGIASPPVGLRWDREEGLSVETSSGLAYYWPDGLEAESEIKPPSADARLGSGTKGTGVAELLSRDAAKAMETFVVPAHDGSIEYLRVVGVDRDRNLSLEFQLLKDGELLRQLRRYSEDGLLLGFVEIPHSTYAYAFRDLQATADGSVFQMIPAADGVHLICWQLTQQEHVATIPQDLPGLSEQDVTMRLKAHWGTEPVLAAPVHDVELSAPSAVSVTPSEVLYRAEAYRDHNFYVGWGNITPAGGVYCDSKVVETPITVPGWYQGVVYKWGGFTGLEGVSTVTDCGYYFDAGLAAGLYAGDINTSTSYESCCAVGVDCSGFVSQAWNMPSKYSTAGLPSICCELPALDKLLPSDIVNLPGQHTRLFLEREADGRYTFIEASHYYGKVLELSYTASQLTSGGYGPYRKRGNLTLFSVGDRVEALENLNVRSCAGITCPIVTLEVAGSGGTITSGPAEADGYTWLYVSFDDGHSGWSVQCYLQPILCTPPGDFGLQSPPNMAVFPSSTTSLTLIWDASSGAGSYDVYFGESPDPPYFDNREVNWRIVSVDPGKTYYWRIVAKNACGSTETNSGTWSFSISCDPPGSFVLLSPTKFTQLPSGTTQVTLSWETASGATSYDVYFGTNTIPLYYTNVAATTTSVPVTSDQTYYWKVVAKNSCGSTESDSGVWIFSVKCGPPDPFPMLSPSNGTQLPAGTTQATLSWAAANGATSYDVYFGTSSDPTIHTSTSSTSTSVPVTSNQTYYWRIVAKNSCSTTDSSSGIWSFSVSCSSPGPFVLLSPANGTQLPAGTTQTTLSWAASAGATSYEVYFGTSASPPLAGNTPTNSTDAIVSSGQTYYWRIVAKNSCGSTESSSGTWSFSVSCEPPGPFVLQSPGNGTQLPAGTTQTTLSWAESAGAASYDVHFGASPSPSLSDNTTATSTSVSVSSGQTYYWRIVAKNSCGSTESSSGTWNFAVDSEGVIFSDGFESGDLSEWSSSVSK